MPGKKSQPRVDLVKHGKGGERANGGKPDKDRKHGKKTERCLDAADCGACDGCDLLGCDLSLLLLACLAGLTAVRAVVRPGPALRSDARRYPSRAAALLARGKRAYQRHTSAAWGARCRYIPSCSVYALDALQQHGACRGAFAARARLRRCRPGVPVPSGGVDEV